ncbi:41623_t:CDS:2, partial [Gigaspora margarita]
MKKVKNNSISISLMCDLWTGKNRQGFLGITCSYLDHNFQFHEITLSIEHIRHPHTAENIGDNILSLLGELELLGFHNVLTHWNSSYSTWCRFLELEKYIRVLEFELAKDKNHDSNKDSQHLTKIMLTKNEWDLLHNLIPILGPFEEATRYLDEEINLESIKDIFAELEIYDDDGDLPKKKYLNKPMQISRILEK